MKPAVFPSNPKSKFSFGHMPQKKNYICSNIHVHIICLRSRNGLVVKLQIILVHLDSGLGASKSRPQLER